MDFRSGSMDIRAVITKKCIHVTIVQWYTGPIVHANVKNHVINKSLVSNLAS